MRFCSAGGVDRARLQPPSKTAAHASKDERHDEQDKRHEEDDLRKTDCRAGYPAEPQQPGDQCDDEKGYHEMQHGLAPESSDVDKIALQAKKFRGRHDNAAVQILRSLRWRI